MDLDKLNNMTQFELNTTILNNTNEIGQNIIDNANTTTDGYFGLIVMTIIFLFLAIILFADQDVFRLDNIKSILMASGFTTIIGIIGLVTGIFSNFPHVMWFATVFLITLIINYYANKGG